MECKKVKDLLSPYLEEDLEEGLQRQVASHIAACTNCQALKEGVEFLISFLPELEVDVPDSLRERLCGIPATFAKPKTKVPLFSFSKWAAVFVGTIVLFFNLFYFTNVFPAANREMHSVVFSISRWISKAEGLVESVKDSRDIVFSSLAKKQPRVNPVEKSAVEKEKEQR